MNTTEHSPFTDVPSEFNTLAGTIAFSVAGVLILGINSLTVVTVARYKNLHTVTNVFVLSLALSDSLLAFPVLFQQYVHTEFR